jgi:hypothetical protein
MRKLFREPDVVYQELLLADAKLEKADVKPCIRQGWGNRGKNGSQEVFPGQVAFKQQ